MNDCLDMIWNEVPGTAGFVGRSVTRTAKTGSHVQLHHRLAGGGTGPALVSLHSTRCDGTIGDRSLPVAKNVSQRRFTGSSAAIARNRGVSRLIKVNQGPTRGLPKGGVSEC